MNSAERASAHPMDLNSNALRLNALTAFQARRFIDALACLDELVNRTNHPWDHRWRGLTLLSLGRYADAYESFEMLRDRCPEDPKTLPILALIKSSCPDALFRNAEIALDLANRHVSMNGADWSSLSVLAAAHAEAGEFDEAIRCINDAIQMSPSNLADRFKRRREQYQNHKPYRLPTDGFDGLIPDKRCQLCGADAFCSDGYPGSTTTTLCLDCAKRRFAAKQE
jgi:tetratricopeptide (TPR) repeat protein